MGVLAIALAALLFPCTQVEGQQTTCISNYQFTAYEMKVNYSVAQEKCRESGQYLAIIADPSYIDEFKKIVRVGKYYIGAKLDGCEYKWHDGNLVNLAWESGQLEDKEKCVVINRAGLLEDESCASEYFYICQKHFPLKVTSNPTYGTYVVSGTYRLTCSGQLRCNATNSTHVWLDERGYNITQSTSSDIYQIQTPLLESVLVVTNANVSKDREYTCRLEGSSGSSEQMIRVLAAPIIEDVVTANCSSTITITLRGSTVPRTSRAEIRIRIFNERYDKESRHSAYSIQQRSGLTFTSLQPSTEYQVWAYYFPLYRTSGYHFYQHASVNVTTHGVPNEVTSVHVYQQGNYCTAEWDPPNVISDGIIGYEIEVNRGIYSPRRFRIEGTWYYNTTNTSYVFEMQPMMRYSVFIRTVTCAGTGYFAPAYGTCIGTIQAPAVVEKPLVTQTDINAKVKIFVPNEIRGLISCLFVVVARGEDVKTTLEERHTLGTSNLITNSTILDHYIVIAISYDSVVSNQTVVKTLGDGSISTCNLFKVERNEYTTKNLILIGKNRPVTSELQTRVYVVAVVPYEDVIYVRRSEGFLLESSRSLMIDAKYLAFLAIIPLFLVAAGVIFACWQARKRKAQREDEQSRRDNYQRPRGFNIGNPIKDRPEEASQEIVADPAYVNMNPAFSPGFNSAMYENVPRVEPTRRGATAF